MGQAINQQDPEWGTGELEEFETLALRYVDIAAKEGIKVRAFVDPSMPLFREATPEKRKAATEFLNTIVSIHEETLAAGHAAIKSQKLIWRALSKLGLVPTSDLFEHFTDEDIVLIYSEEQSVIFWTLQFFKFSSFTIEQLFFCVWYNFTKREPEIQQKLYNLAVNIVTGKVQGNFVPDVPEHTVEEVDSPECMKTMMGLPFASILTRDGKMAGFLVVQTMRVIT